MMPGSSRTKSISVLGWAHEDQYQVALYDRKSLMPIYEGRLRYAVMWAQQKGLA